LSYGLQLKFQKDLLIQCLSFRSWLA